MVLHDALALLPDDDLEPIPVRGDPSGLAFDARTGALFVADAFAGAVVRVDGPLQRRIATVAVGGAIGGDRVGGLAVTPFGAVFATRLGHGLDGTIVRIDPDGRRPLESVEKLAPSYWRLGVTYDLQDHALFVTQFAISPRGAHDGSVVSIDLITGEPSTILDGFAKPIGIAKLGSTLVIADARQRAVFRVDLVAGRAVQRLQLVGDIGRPDSVCACGSDSVLVTSYDDELRRGAVRRLWLDGRTRGIASGAWEPRGVAFDGERVFVSARREGRVLVFPL